MTTMWTSIPSSCS